MTKADVFPALEAEQVSARTGSSYPKPFRAEVKGRTKRALGDALGLTHFGVNLVELAPGAWSSQRHWHSAEDELVYVIRDELTLVTDAGRRILREGSVAGFPAGRDDGHHLINESDRPALYLEVGDRSDADRVHYPDIDLELTHRGEGRVFCHRDGRAYGDD